MLCFSRTNIKYANYSLDKKGDICWTLETGRSTCCCGNSITIIIIIEKEVVVGPLILDVALVVTLLLKYGKNVIVEVGIYFPLSKAYAK